MGNITKGQKVKYIKKPHHITKGVVYYRIYLVITQLRFFKSEHLIDPDTLNFEESERILIELNGVDNERSKTN